MEQLRKVKFKDFDSETKQWIEGEGFFHRWGDTFEAVNQQIGNFTFAIVEDYDGKIWEVMPHHMQFTNPSTTQS